MGLIRIRNTLFFVAIIVILGASASCAHIPKLGEALQRGPKTLRGGNNSLLPTMPLPTTGVDLDVYVIRVPYDRHDLFEQFWDDVEESEVPSQIRNSLYQHGLRQGMLSSKIPVSLERLLELRDIPPQRPFEKVTTADELAGVEKLHKYKTVPMMKNQPVEFPTFNPISKLPVLALVDGSPTGQVYTNAEGFILISTEEQPDGSVIVKTTPEIHYGEEKRKITSSGGMLKPMVYKSKLSFDQLTVETKLLLGQWVVIGPDARSLSGFGRDILSQNTGTPEEILIAIRLRRTRKDGIHDRNDIVLANPLEGFTVQEPMGGVGGMSESRSDFPASLADQELGRDRRSGIPDSLFD